ncbi:MAG: hypothetical protein R6V72_06910 [Cyclobacterium sp.]|uniref:hypothetical protein n=1 Tax=Cyclobacterium sp. TaxID=1966343 RepID=UPI003970733E
MKYFSSYLVLVTMILSGCTETLNSEDVKMKNGIYVYSRNEKPLDGKYRKVIPIGGTYDGDEEITFEYNNGVPTESWTYMFNGDLIHSGTYLIENELKSEINNLTSSKRTDLCLWEEGGYYTLDIDLVLPDKVDSAAIEKVVDLATEQLTDRHQFSDIDVYLVTDTDKKIYKRKK